MKYSKGEKLYEGKAKVLFTVVENSDLVFQEFKNSLTAFNGVKKGEFPNKGELNRQITSGIFRFLRSQGIQSHWVADVGTTGLVTQKLKMVPLEVVVRNRAAGSLAKKFGWEEGKKLEHPLVELYFKNDELGDPFVSDEQAILLQTGTLQDLQALKAAGLKINTALQSLFSRAGLDLIDFKLEFGKDSAGQLLLADEVTPDTCRLWDLKSGERMDKDRFRRDLGRVQETYEEVCQRVLAQIGGEPK